MHKLPRKLQDQVAAEMYPKLRQLRQKQEGMIDDILIKAALSPYPFTLWLDYRVPSLNTVLYRNRYVLMGMKKKAQAAVNAALAVAVGYPRARGRMHVIYTSYVCQLRDSDNLMTKWANDALRHAGVLLADDPTGMLQTVNPEVRVNKRKLEGTKITIVEALP